MSANLLLDQLRLPRKRPPSGRDRAVYERVLLNGERQEAVAKELGISQPRVAQIVHQVEDWVQATLTAPLAKPAEAETACGERLSAELSAEEERSSLPDNDLTSAERLRLAEHLAYERLEYVYQEAIRAWRKSLEDSTEQRTRGQGASQVAERITKTQTGKVGLLNQAMRAAMASARLLGVEMTGKEARKRAAEEAAQELQAANALRSLQAAQDSALDSKSPRATSAAAAQTTYKPENSRADASSHEDRAMALMAAELAAGVDAVLAAA